MRGLYIHIPFCRSKCIYCDFVSFANKNDLKDEYMRKLCSEMTQYDGMSFDTVYIGGGTPTVLDDDDFKKLFAAIRSNFDIAPHSEITVEANPATVTASKAGLLRALGVNRISLGAQSFVDSELMAIGRIHSASDTAETVHLLRDEGFDNISIDLMYALPGQTAGTLEHSIESILNLEPEHISCYGLKVEAGTKLAEMVERKKITEASEDDFADMYEKICDLLSKNGYGHYEISNFSKPGFESKHNCKYWRCEEYLGLGLGASSYINGVRYANARRFEDYFDGYKRAESEKLSQDDMMSEFIILGLRMLKSGVDITEFKRLFHRSVESVFGDVIEKNTKLGMLSLSDGKLSLTERAYCISNSVMCEFML